MKHFDNLIIFKISKYLKKDILNVILVSKEWYALFHPAFLYLKPKKADTVKLKYILDNLKLGYHYDKYQTICNIYCEFREFKTKDQTIIIRALRNKLYLDKPFINFVPLKKQIIIDNYLTKLI